MTQKTNSTYKKKITGFHIPVILLSLVFMQSCGGVEMSHAREEKTISVTSYLDRQIKTSKMPGAQYMVLDRDKTLFEYAGGMSDIKNGKTMTLDTTMMAFSMTKTFTAVAILQLVENKKISLDDTIDRYIDNNPYDDTITIRQLIAHTSGIPSPIPLKWVHPAAKHGEFNEDEALNRVLEEHGRMQHPPGRKYLYSNIGYWYLGKIIEKVSGQSYASYIGQYIMEPLNLSSTEIGCIIPGAVPHAKGYLAKYSFLNLIKGLLIDDELTGGYEGSWLRIEPAYLNGPAFGGLIGSAASFSRFLQDQLQENSVLFNDTTKKLLYSTQVDSNGNPVPMSLGWHIGHRDGIQYFYKEGGGAGFQSEMRIYPEQNLATILIINTTSFKLGKQMNALDNEFLQ
jgi:D-alanyl-D-alanine carboxypeptidase